MIDDQARKAALDNAVAGYARQGWRMEARGEYQATIAKGKNHSHLLHLVLTIITLGVWLLVWIPLALFGGLKQRLLSVDDAGRVHDTKV